ncbi:hypothetical protein RJG79_07920 [Mycoplasmatota bacterium WC44]
MNILSFIVDAAGPPIYVVFLLFIIIAILIVVILISITLLIIRKIKNSHDRYGL